MEDNVIFILVILGVVITVLIISLITILLLRKTVKSTGLPVNNGSIRDATYSNRTMKFIVINKMTKISQQDIIDVIKATSIYMSDFSYHWGIGASFKLVDDYPTKEDILDGSSLVYLVDDVIGENTNFQAIALHWMTLPAPEDSADDAGTQPRELISNAPLIPVGVPVIVIPFGNDNYGLASKKKDTNGDMPYIKDVLGEAFSHEVFETLINPYAANGGSYQVYNDGIQITLFTREVCDPTENNQQVRINGISLSNFVTPDYFNPLAPKNSLFDYMGLIKEPLKPYNGNQYGITIKGSKINYFMDISRNGNEPERFTR